MRGCLRRRELAFARLVVFDLDGTIIDLDVDWQGLKRALGEMIRTRYGRDIPFTSLSEGLTKCRESLGSEALLHALRIVQRFEAGGVRRATVRADTVQLINNLSERGRRMAVFSTNRRATVRAALERFGLREHFALLVSADDVSRPKPDPEGLFLILRRLKVPAPKAIYVGDRPTDAECGGRAGVRTLLVGDAERSGEA